MAAESWAATPLRQRAEILRGAFDLLQERKDDFALLITLEMGKPLAESRGEVAYGGEFLRWFCDEAVCINGRYGLNPEGTGHMIASQRPVGPCLLITRWNFSLAMATRKIAPALAAGCTVVVKPAELTPLTKLLFVELLEKAGLPAGVVNVFTTSAASTVCAPIIADPRLRILSFTGSTPVGRNLLAQAAQGILRTSMELGGNAPFLVFEDADLEQAVDGAMQAKLRQGKPESIDLYNVHDRLLSSSSDSMADAAFSAWREDTRAGRASVLISDSNEAVAAMNVRARSELILENRVDAFREISLHDGTSAAVGDTVVTRRNDRRLRAAGAWVRNGDRWAITGVNASGSIDVRRNGQRWGSAARLPAECVKRFVELGYAVTSHRAQGITTDTAHVVVSSGMTRENLYVGMTRGRFSNTAYVAINQPDVAPRRTSSMR